MKNLRPKKAPVVDDAMAEAKSSQPAIFPELPKVLEEEILSYIMPFGSSQLDADGKPLPAIGKQIMSVSKLWRDSLNPYLLCDRVVCGIFCFCPKRHQIYP